MSASIESGMIATHHAPHCEQPWIAVDMAAAAKLLEGYGLTEKEKTELPELLAGYCRLLDDAELCFYGDTEQDVIAACKANGERKAMSAKQNVNEPVPASDLFSDDLRSAPPWIVILRRRYDDASEAYHAASDHEDESGEEIPPHIHKAYIRATDRLRAEEARVASLVASENDTLSGSPPNQFTP